MSYGIPTVGPKGIQFRSRIEAQWAYIFETLKWKWEYEPIDLNGYIPDFIITFANNIQVLVEVKGDTNIWDKAVYTPHAEKILKSGWTKNYLIVGASYKKGESIDDWINIGVGDCGQFYDDDEDKIEFKFKHYMIDSYCLIKNKNINNWDIFGNVGQFDLGINGSKDWRDFDDESYTLFENIWTISKNLVQWKGKQMNAKVIKKK